MTLTEWLAAERERLHKVMQRASPLGMEPPSIMADCDEYAALLDVVEAANKAADGMDQAGGDNCGMPECPWCHAQFEYLRDDSHAPDCELLALRTALAALTEKQT